MFVVAALGRVLERQPVGPQVRKLVLLTASVAFLALQTPSANATTFNWSYSDGGSNVGNGTLEATFLGSDTYQVTSISGIADGDAITGLSTYLGADNFVFSPSPPDVALDTLGMAFDVSGLGSLNVYEDFGNFAPGDVFSCGGAPYCIIGPGIPGVDSFAVAVDFSLSPVPEPLTLSLFGAGLAGAVAMRRRKKVAA